VEALAYYINKQLRRISYERGVRYTHNTKCAIGDGQNQYELRPHVQFALARPLIGGPRKGGLTVSGVETSMEVETRRLS
jgi:hypothetical protein